MLTVTQLINMCCSGCTGAMMQEIKTLTSLVLENYGPFTENLCVSTTHADVYFDTLETDSTECLSKLLLNH